MTTLKKRLKKKWLGKAIKKFLGRNRKAGAFKNSKSYWEDRYRSKDNSGAGSYGRLAEFKAEILNQFVANNGIKSVIEYGVGDGNQLSLASYPSYIGFDVSRTALSLCKKRFKHDTERHFYMMSDPAQRSTTAELCLSLDVIYHLVEDEVFDSYMQRLFDTATKYVIVYSSNYDDHFAPHVKSRKFTPWVEKNRGNDFILKEVVKNKYPFDANDPDNTSMADFYIYERRK